MIVADKTRLCGYPEFLPPLAAVLGDFGFPPDALDVHIAYGTHAPQSERESLESYGEVFRRMAFHHHDCDDARAFVELGSTSRGTPVRLRRDVLEAPLRISFGAVSHHYFAGFGGGRKLVFPGLGERRAVHANHSLFLNRALGRLDPRCQPGLLDGNPLAEDIRECAEPMGVHLQLHGLLDHDGHVRDILAGSGWDSFADACRRHAALTESADPGGYDLVIASCGGHPKDINIIQAHKALHHAAAFARDGGRVALLAACPDGVGSKSFLPWFDLGGPRAAFDRLLDAYEGNGGTALAMMEKTARLDIAFLTGIDAGICARIGARRLESPAALARMAREAMADGGRIAVLPNASVTVSRPALGVDGRHAAKACP